MRCVVSALFSVPRSSMYALCIPCASPGRPRRPPRFSPALVVRAAFLPRHATPPWCSASSDPVGTVNLRALRGEIFLPVNPLECAVPRNAPITPLECAVPKMRPRNSFRLRTSKKTGGWGRLSLAPSRTKGGGERKREIFRERALAGRATLASLR